MTRPARTRRAARPATPEGVVLAACLRLLEWRGIYHWRHNNVAVSDRGHYRAFAGMRGVSDVLGVLPGGRFLAVEVKSPRGRLSEHQRAFLAAAWTMGAVAVVIRDVARLHAILDRLADDPDAIFPIE